MKNIINYTPFGFQADTISKGLQILKTYRGVFIMDETGLGKTVTAAHLAVNSATSVLVISPKGNQSDWTAIFKLTDIAHRITTIQSISKVPLSSYDCVIIDEAHRFGNAKSKGFQELFKIIYSQPKTPNVILLSATPINNNITEFRNILSLIPFTPQSVPFLTLGSLFKRAEEAQKLIDDNGRFNEGRHSTKVFTKQSQGLYLPHILSDISSVCKLFSVRNTRQNILVQYPDDMELMGHFPIVNPSQLEFKLSADKVHKTIHLIKKCTMAAQNISVYCDGNDTNLMGMGGIYKTFLFKRMESSVFAFKKSVANNIDKIESLINAIPAEYEISDKTNILNDLNNDLKLFKEIAVLWMEETDTSKIGSLMSAINGKTIIFTEYKDTLYMIEHHLRKAGIKYITYFGGDDENKLLTIRNNFDANHLTANKIDVLLCTDALSEGISLHGAHNLIHFDNKWNPSRMIQREGRINRILKNGINRSSVTTNNFKIPYHLEEIIKLEEKLDDKTFMADIILSPKNNTIYTTEASVFENMTTFMFESKKNVTYIIIKAVEGFLCFVDEIKLATGIRSTVTKAPELPSACSYTKPMPYFYVGNTYDVYRSQCFLTFKGMEYDSPSSFHALSKNYLYAGVNEIIKSLQGKGGKVMFDFINGFFNNFDVQMEVCKYVLLEPKYMEVEKEMLKKL